jgi:hypothetical protein
LYSGASAQWKILIADMNGRVIISAFWQDFGQSAALSTFRRRLKLASFNKLSYRKALRSFLLSLAEQIEPTYTGRPLRVTDERNSWRCHVLNAAAIIFHRKIVIAHKALTVPPIITLRCYQQGV